MKSLERNSAGKTESLCHACSCLILTEGGKEGMLTLCLAMWAPRSRRELSTSNVDPKLLLHIARHAAGSVPTSGYTSIVLLASGRYTAGVHGLRSIEGGWTAGIV